MEGKCEVSGFKDYFMGEKKTKGTYSAVRIRHAKQLRKSLQELHPDIDVIDEDLMHCTLLFSRKFLPDYVPDPSLEHQARISGLEVWDTQDKKRALVATLDCPSLVARHKELMKEHEATYDHPEYKPHFTISYDIGDLPKPEVTLNQNAWLTLTDEYMEDLKLEWKPE